MEEHAHTGCGCQPSRRQIVLGAAAGAAMLAAAPAFAQPTPGPVAASPVPGVRKIDVHHHIYPPQYLSRVTQLGPQPPFVRDWTPERSIEDMDSGNVGTALVSITTPGLWFGEDKAARDLARACNEYGAALVQSHPGRFCMLGAMPLPDVDGTLVEIAYALDTLKTDGIGLFTSYSGKWLGDDAFTPVLAELNRRKALVFVHPTTAACCGNLISFLPDPMIEFGTDTTRTIGSLVFSGAAERFPDIRWIFSHAGGTMPFLIERFIFQANTPDGKRRLPNGVLPSLRRFHYDTAQASNPAAMGGLTKLVPVSQIVFGTDYPYRTTAEHVANIRGCGFSDADLAMIERSNAVRLVPRLGQI